jgi:glycosyltransferase involved in cell wall biosynthesis
LVNPAIINRLRNGRFDAVLIHGHQYSTMLMAVFAAKLTKTAKLMRSETHLKLRRSPIKLFLRKLLLMPYYRQFDAFLAIGSLNASFYKAFQVPMEKIFIVPYAVDNQFFARPRETLNDQREEIRKAYNLPQKKPVILFVSKLQERKHPLHLLKAYALLSEEGSDASLVFVGSGEQEETLENFVKQNNVPDVTFLGFRNQKELPLLFSISDLFVLPSENEPWGLVINEAMAAGLPIIATQEIGAVPDLVHDNVNGFTYPAGDIQALSQHLRVLISDRQLRSRMGKASKSIIDEWDYDRGVRELRAALASVRNA